MKGSVFAGIALGWCLAGCVSSGDTPAVIAAARRPVTCTAGADCEAKWSRAVAWVAQNSSYKVQSSSDSLIQTMGPITDSPSPAYTVSKIAAPDAGTYQIVMNGGCDNVFGCLPTMAQSKVLFGHFVMTGSSD